MRASVSSLNPENHPFIWLQDPTTCCGNLDIPTFPMNEKPVELGSIDSVLWNDFGMELDKHLSQMNRGLKLFVYCAVISGLFMALAVNVFVRVVELNWQTSKYIIPGIVFLNFALTIGWQWSIISKNEAIEKEITSICDQQFQSRFRALGYSLEYRTKWTGKCKPKGARPTRCIVFVPVARAFV